MKKVARERHLVIIRFTRIHQVLEEDNAIVVVKCVRTDVQQLGQSLTVVTELVIIILVVLKIRLLLLSATDQYLFMGSLLRQFIVLGDFNLV